MQNRISHSIVLFCAIGLLCSCASRKVFLTNYYHDNEKTLTVIEQSFRKLYDQKRFSVGFTDFSFNDISLEIITDSIKYIYEFETQEPRFRDTLNKYGLPVQGITELIRQMKSIKCIWINNLDYYTNNQKRSLVFMSIKPAVIHVPFTPEKYYILTFFSQPQYYDNEGNLLAGRKLRKLRKINDDVFMRVNDKVAFTKSNRFR